MKPMTVEKGTLERCLEGTESRAGWTKFASLDQHGVHRVKGINNGLLVALKHVRRIREAATRDGCTSVLALLDEELEFAIK